MASAADIGANNSSYQGNSALGGGSFGFVKLDTDPIQDLAKYQMLYNRSEYEQRQKDTEKAANEIADVTSYDLTTGIPKDAKLLSDKYDQLTTYIRDNPDATNYRNKKSWTDYNRMKNDLENDLRGAKVRNTMFALRQKEIQDETNPQTRKLMQDELDKEIADTDIRTPLKHSQQYADFSIKLPDAPSLSFDVTKVGPNAIVARDVKVFNVPKARANGDVFAIGLDGAIDTNTPEGKRADISKKQNFWVQGAESFNSVLNAKDSNGEFLYKTKTTDASGNVTYSLDESKLSKLPRGILSLVKQTNDYLTKFKEDVKSGIYKDKFEKPITFGDGALDENDYKEINYEDGLSPEELALVAQYSKWNGDTYTTKIQPTDNAIQITAQAENARHNKAMEGIDWGKLKLDTDKWHQTMTGGETVKNGAMERAKRIYSDMLKLADSNGVISTDKVRQLDQEQLKYLGIETVTTSDQGVPRSVFTPLQFKNKKGDEVPVALQLVNGQVKVLKDPRKLESGQYEGLFDNEKSTNVFNIATNVLNEELTKAGTKELNSYMPIDLGTGGISVNTTGTSQSQSSSTKTKSNIVNGYEIPDGAIIVNSKKTGKPIGYTLNGKNYKF